MAKSKGEKTIGHYCRMCGECKANEQFLGKGHAVHICKQCSSLPADEQAEQQALNKIEGMAGRHLSDREVQWLRKKMKNKRPFVKCFLFYRRNRARKGGENAPCGLLKAIFGVSSIKYHARKRDFKREKSL